MMPTFLYPTIIRFPLERANGVQVVNTCHALAEIGCRVHLFVLKSSRDTVEQCLRFYGLKPAPTLHVVRAPYIQNKGERFWNMSAYASCFLAAMGVFLREKKPVILTRDLHFARVFLPWVKSGRCKLVYECHHVEHLYRKELPALYSGAASLPMGRLERIKKNEEKIYRSASGIITTTAKLKEMLKSLFSIPTPVQEIHDGCALNAQRGDAEEINPSRKKTEKTRLLYVGDLNPIRGVRVILQAVRHLSDVHLTLVGGLSYEKDLQDLKASSNVLNIDSRVDFKGYVEPYKIPELYRDADIVLLPLSRTTNNQYFASPLKLFEYMSMGKPIVAVDFPSIREVLRHEETALLVSSDDETGWINAIRRLQSEPHLAEKISQNALRLSKEYTWRKRAEKIVAFVKTLNAG